MPNLAPVDLMILLIYFFFVLVIGVGLKAYTATSADFLLAGRKFPGWLCGLALAGAGLGSLEVLAMGAAGARYGLVSASFFGLGSVVPLVFAALFLVPVYSASKARSLPEYLRLRFDEKTRLLNAIWSLVALLTSAVLAFYVMARVSAALRLFSVMFHTVRMGPQSVLLLSVALPAAFVLVCVAMGGLGATMYAQVMQFFVLAAGFLPMVFLGLRQVGGWSGMKASFAALNGPPPSGWGAAAAAAALGAVLTAGAACTDSSVLQTTLAAKDARAARSATLLGAAMRALLPLLLILPGVLAASLPTPHSSTTVRNENGTIFHEIDVVPQAVEQGQGLVPAQTDNIADPMDGNILRDAAGHARIDYGMATPSLAPHNLPTGLLGLALAALMACLTGGVAGRVSAFNTIFVYDIYQAHLRREASEKHLTMVGRFATLGAVLVSAALACGALWLPGVPDVLDLLAVSLAVLFAPMLGTYVLGVLWKRATGCAAFAGLMAGLIAALVHWGLTVPAGYRRGVAGGWISAVHRPHSMLMQNAGTALTAILVNLLVTVVVSEFTTPKPEAELAGLVHGTMPAERLEPAGWKRPAVVGAIVVLAALVVSLIFL